MQKNSLKELNLVTLLKKQMNKKDWEESIKKVEESLKISKENKRLAENHIEEGLRTIMHVTNR